MIDHSWKKRVRIGILTVVALTYLGGVFALGFAGGYSSLLSGSAVALNGPSLASIGGRPTVTPTVGTPLSSSPTPAVTPSPSVPTSPSAPGVVTVTILTRGSGFVYAPASLSIPIGTMVRWTNASNAPHTVTGAGLDSGFIAVGGQFNATFSEPGTFSYRCTFHPSMTGILVVYRADGVAPTPPPVPTPAPVIAPPAIPTTPPPPGVVSVTIVQGANFTFSPATVTIPLGTTVRWTNATSAPHTVTASGAFDSGTIPSGVTYTRTFNQLGTFNYVCAFHPNMTGSVTVTGATNPSATPIPSPQAQVALVKHDGNYFFSPADLSIPVGTTVTWINTTGDELTIDGPDFQSPLLPKGGGSWSHTFTAPGTYSYTSRLRPEMTGTILVSDI